MVVNLVVIVSIKIIDIKFEFLVLILELILTHLKFMLFRFIVIWAKKYLLLIYCQLRKVIKFVLVNYILIFKRTSKITFLSLSWFNNKDAT